MTEMNKKFNLKEILQEIKKKNEYKCELRNNDDYIYFYVKYDDEVDKLRLMLNYDKFNKINLLTTKSEELTQSEIQQYLNGTKEFINLLKKYVYKVDFSLQALGSEGTERYETEDVKEINEIIKEYCLNDVASMYNFIASFSKSVIMNYQNEVKQKIKKKQKNT